MKKNSQSATPVLIPMFEVFNKILYNNKLEADQTFIVVGEVCIDKDYRGKGLLNKGYQAYRIFLKN